METGERLQQYFQRIDYPGSSEPTLENLRQITWLHQIAIPFENLDIVLFQRPISLTPDDIYDKLVTRKRGGYCFEQNGLLALALTWMGYAVSMGYATWLSDEGEQVPAFDHLVLKVSIPGDETPWLADAGFGRDSPARPIPLALSREEHHPETGVTYRVKPLDTADRQWAVHWRNNSDIWSLLYELDLRPRTMADFEHRSQYHQTSVASNFKRGMICSRPFHGGRVTVATGILILTKDDEREEHVLAGKEDECSALRKWFGIEVTQEDKA